MPFSLNQAMKAQAALRSAAGQGEESFDEEQLIGMLSDEIRTLRDGGSTDEDIAALLEKNADLPITAETITRYYVDTSGWKRDA